MGAINYSSPQRIKPEDKIDDFDCQESSLNNWLKKRALKNDLEDASRTYVVCCGDRVVAYYSLHLGCIKHSEALGKIKRNLPDPIPAIVLGRLAVDINHQKQGIARALIKDMFLRSLQVADLAGTKAVLVKSLNEKVLSFYQSFGFIQSKTDPLLLMKAISEVRASFNEAMK